MPARLPRGSRRPSACPLAGDDSDDVDEDAAADAGTGLDNALVAAVRLRAGVTD
jgi:hypothetical protein